MRLFLIQALLILLLGSICSPVWAEVVITVDKSTQRMSVSVDGQERFLWPVSTGASDYETPSGEYRPLRMERDHFSKEWDNAPMPNSIFFTGEGHAIHGTSHVRQLGTPASHGCVRLAPRNAATLYALVRAEGLGRTHVVVEGNDAVISDLIAPESRVPRNARHSRHRQGDDVNSTDTGRAGPDLGYVLE